MSAVWAVVALVELALWWVLYRNRFYQPLWLTPALVAIIGGVAATVHALRVRSRERRAGDRRDAENARRAKTTPAA